MHYVYKDLLASMAVYHYVIMIELMIHAAFLLCTSYDSSLLIVY